MGAIEFYKDLEVWKLGIKQCVAVCRITKTFPRDELYGIVSQMRRAAVSIPANIAEGYARRYDREKARFVSTALGSNAELETHLIVAEKLEYISGDVAAELRDMNDHVGRSLTNFYRSLVG